MAMAATNMPTARMREVRMKRPMAVTVWLQASEGSER